MNKNIVFPTLAVSMLAVLFSAGNQQQVRADCDLPGTAHDDNSPSSKKGEKLIKEGATACELAKKCDAMEIKVKIDSDELKQAHFYQMADSDLKDELEEVAEHGHGASGIECYELEYAVEESS